MTATPAMLPATLGPVLEFMRSLWALDHALAERAKKVGTHYGITGTQRLVVRIVGQSPGASAGTVARVLHVHPSTLTPVLQQLVVRNLMQRTADPLDRRRAVLFLTARGERVDAASASGVDEHVRTALARVSPSEVFHARRVMQAVVDALGIAEQAATKPRARKRSVRPVMKRTVTKLSTRVVPKRTVPKASDPMIRRFTRHHTGA